MSSERIWELVQEKDKVNYEVDDSVVFRIDDPKDQRVIEKKWGEADGTCLPDGIFITKLRGDQVIRESKPNEVPTYRYDFAVPRNRT